MTKTAILSCPSDSVGIIEDPWIAVDEVETVGGAVDAIAGILSSPPPTDTLIRYNKKLIGICDGVGYKIPTPEICMSFQANRTTDGYVKEFPEHWKGKHWYDLWMGDSADDLSRLVSLKYPGVITGRQRVLALEIVYRCLRKTLTEKVLIEKKVQNTSMKIAMSSAGINAPILNGELVSILDDIYRGGRLFIERDTRFYFDSSIQRVRQLEDEAVFLPTFSVNMMCFLIEYYLVKNIIGTPNPDGLRVTMELLCNAFVPHKKGEAPIGSKYAERKESRDASRWACEIFRDVIPFSVVVRSMVKNGAARYMPGAPLNSIF